MLILEGKAKKPVYLLIEDGKAELRSAEAFWGMTVSETTDAIVAATAPKAKVACVGPAGKNWPGSPAS